MPNSKMKSWNEQDAAFFGDHHQHQLQQLQEGKQQEQSIISPRRQQEEKEDLEVLGRGTLHQESVDMTDGKNAGSSSSSSSSSSNVGKEVNYMRLLSRLAGRGGANKIMNLFKHKHKQKQKNQDENQERNNDSTNDSTTSDIKDNSDHDDDVSQEINNKQQQEQQEEDARLARVLQEEEDQQMQQQQLQRNARRSWVGSYPGQRRHSQGLMQGFHPTASTTNNVPRCATCYGMVGGLMPLVVALGNVYHPECFKCIGCHGTIQDGESFASMLDTNGKRYPLHRQCYAELYGIKCTVCQETIDQGAPYLRHPFFDSEYLCSKHSSRNSCRTCTGCYRFEPLVKPFANLDDDDANRCICDSCLRTVIVDNDDAKPLWEKIIKFFQQHLKLPIWDGMRDIPVLIVGYNALNQQQQQMHNNVHGGSSQIMTRGLCLSEHMRGGGGLGVGVGLLDWGNDISNFVSSTSSPSSNPGTTVTAILCLTGLPADLTCSILAHEATHAWMKLHPNFNVDKPIPSQVEEGCCQLIAMLFLTDGYGDGDGLEECRSTSSMRSTQGPSDKKLRQYFKFSIETDSNEIYGEGYRKAARIYAEIGIEALLSHVVNYQAFPNI